MKLRDNGKYNAIYGHTLVGYHLIDGEECESLNGETFVSTNPACTADRVAEFPLATEQDVENACRAAGKAFEDWKNTPAPIRGQIMGNLGTLLEQHKESLARLVTREIGKVYKESLGEVQEMIDTAHFFQSEGRRLYGQTVPSEMRHKQLFTYRRPKGVCALITACNFPVAVPSWKIIPALLCGNTVVWKPSEEAPAVAYMFGRILEEAGVPKGVVNIVHGPGAVGEALLKMVDKGLIQKVSFTGSTAVGRKIGEVCGRNLIIPSLELGGKNPLVIMEDADLDLAVTGAVWSTYGTAGQRCTSTGNLILHKKIAAAFKERFLEQVKKIRIGDPNLDHEVGYGPLICQKFQDNFQNHYEWAQKDGARLLYGNGEITRENKPKDFVGDPDLGFYAWPVIWDQVTIDMKLAQQEVFGPVIPIIEVADFDEAIAVANGTPYGLSSAIYTHNMQYALRYKNEIKAGMTSVNNSTTGAEAHLPFGGNGWSGNGTRESGIWVIDAYTQWQCVNEDLSGKLQLAQMETEYVVADKEQVEFRGVLAD